MSTQNRSEMQRLVELLGHLGRKLDRLDRKLDLVLELEIHMAQDLTDLTDTVSSIETVDGSILALVDRMAAEILAAAPNNAAIAALAARLKTQRDAIAAAVVANTPAAPA